MSRPYDHPDVPCGCGYRWTCVGIAIPRTTTLIWVCGACWKQHPQNARRHALTDLPPALPLPAPLPFQRVAAAPIPLVWDMADGGDLFGDLA